MDLDNDDALDFEAFIHAVHGAVPRYDLLWKELMAKKKYLHWRTIETGGYSEDTLKGILKNKKANFKDHITAIRVSGDVRYRYHSIALSPLHSVDGHIDGNVCYDCYHQMLADPHMNDKDTRQMMVKLVPGLLSALRIPNGYIQRVTCLALADVAKSKKSSLRKYIAKILNVVWELFDCPDPLAAYSAQMLSKCLLKYVPDDEENKVLKTLIQGTNLKDFDAVQKGCFQGIQLFVKKAGNPKVKRKANKEFWSLIVQLIQDNLKEDNETRRQRVYKVLVALEKANEKKAIRILAGFSNQQETEYNNIKSGADINAEDEDEKKENDAENEERAVWEPDVSKRGPRELSRDYEQRKEQLSESIDAYDDEGEALISSDRVRQFLRDLFEVTGQDADIAIKGLDHKLDAHIPKQRLMKWALMHCGKKVKKNPVLEKEGLALGYKTSRKERLQQRVDLFESLKKIELAEHNYAALFDIDRRMCVLQYFLNKK